MQVPRSGDGYRQASNDGPQHCIWRFLRRRADARVGREKAAAKVDRDCHGILAVARLAAGETGLLLRDKGGSRRRQNPRRVERTDGRACEFRLSSTRCEYSSRKHVDEPDILADCGSSRGGEKYFAQQISTFRSGDHGGCVASRRRHFSLARSTSCIRVAPRGRTAPNSRRSARARLRLQAGSASKVQVRLRISSARRTVLFPSRANLDSVEKIFSFFSQPSTSTVSRVHTFPQTDLRGSHAALLRCKRDRPSARSLSRLDASSNFWTKDCSNALGSLEKSMEQQERAMP